MTGWPSMTVEEIAAPGRYSVVGGPFGSALGRKDYVDDGVPVVRGAQLGGPGRFSHADLVYVTDEKADRHPGNLAHPGDVLVTQRGTVGQVGLIPLDAPFERYLLSQSQMKLTVDPSRVNAQFVYYCLLSPESQHAMTGSTISAGVPHINLATFKGMKIPLPSLVEQERVGELLGSIDDLIDNNRRRVKVLEEMALAIYREWFVRFRYPGHENVPLVDSALGPIPDGWNVELLFDVAEVGFGFSFKSKRFADSGPFPVVRIRDVPKGTTQTFSDEVPGERYRVVDGDVLIGMDGDFHLRQWSGGIAWLNQRVARLRPRSGLSAHHLLLAIEMPIREWNAAISGTTVAHLGKRHLEQVQVVIPEDSVLMRATEFFDDVWKQVVSLTQAARSLADMRDLLLPKLVTGQIDLSHLDLDVLTEVATA